jgi:hypothetical protein
MEGDGGKEAYMREMRFMQVQCIPLLENQQRKERKNVRGMDA